MLMRKSLNEVEDLKKFQPSTQLQEEDWSKMKILSLNLLVRYRNCKNEIVCMTRQIFKMLNQYAVDIPTLPVNLCLSHLIQIRVECQARSLGMPSRFTHPVEQSEKQTPVQDQRGQSVPSVKDLVIFSGGDSSKNYGAEQQRLQISDLHFDNFTMPTAFACWKIRFKTEGSTCSKFPTEAMQWIKEVELVDSVDE